MDALLWITLFFALTTTLLAVWVYILERRISRLTGGADAPSLERTIIQNQADIAKLFNHTQAIDQELDQLDLRLGKKIHGVKTLRFNPFQGTGSGGNQSFATALLDEHGDGVVISSLYSREKMSIFAKPIKQRTSEFDLTEEERAVLS
jgi:hypothetical protein